MCRDILEISTKSTKVAIDPQVIDFLTEATTAKWDDQPKARRRTIGRLSGLLWDKGYLPDEDDEPDLAVFDERDNHAEEAASIMVSQRSLIAQALPESGLPIDGRAFLLLERVSVEPRYRGNGLALRLMREARHLFARDGLLVIAKAYPDGANITEEQVLRLANYYTSDETLGFRQLSQMQFPGWIVAHWGIPEAGEGDERYWYP